MKWAAMPDWGSYLVRHGGVNEYSSKEGFDFLQKEYFQIVEERIDYCKQLLKVSENTEICYVLAELYDRRDLDASIGAQSKRDVIFWCNRALKLDSDYKPAKRLLKQTEEWISFIKDFT
jgi:hypothetical protein